MKSDNSKQNFDQSISHYLPSSFEDSILDNIAELMVIQDLDMRVKWANKTAAESVRSTKEKLNGRHCFEIWHQRSEPCENCPVKKTLTTGQVEKNEVSSPDGREWFIRAYPIKNDSGEMVGAIELTFDITAQKKAERALIKSEENYRNLYNSTLVGFWRSRIEDGTLLKVNPAGIHALGYQTEEEVIEKVRASDLYPAEDRKEFLRQLMETGEVASFETTMTLHNGLKKDVLMSARIFPEKGYIEGMVIDISDRVKFEKALKISEKKYRQLYENMRDGSAAVDMTGRIIEFNQAFKKMVGYNDNEIKRLTYNDLTPAKWRQIEAEIIDSQVMKRGYSDTYEKEYIRKDGTVFPVELRTYLIRNENGNPSGMWAFVRDITERRRSEKMILRSEKKYRNLVETISEGMGIVDHDENLLFVNSAACEIYGYAREELIGMNLRQIVIEEDIDKITEGTKLRLTGQKTKHDVRIRRKDGTIRYITISGTPYYDGRGTNAGTFGIFSDITERIMAEKERIRLQDELERSRRMESLGVLAGGVAHDLNNILGPLVAYPEMIMMKLPEDSPARKQVSMMGKCAREAAEVIQDLLTLARRGRYEMAPLDINEVVQAYLSSVNFVELTGKNPDIKLIDNLDTEIDKIMGSSPHLLKVIMNLVINAFDAMPGGGKLTIETSQINLNKLHSGFSNVSQGDYVLLKIKDTGSGIEEKYLKHIFEPYYSKKEMGSSGSGLGLSVVYGILKDHKGYYDINSKVNIGTEFILYFPACKQEAVKKTEACGNYSGSEKILIVDDVAEQREIASEILANFGYRVERAACGREAIEICRKNTYDLIIMDMIMEKDFDGLDTYREIININPGQKAIIVSGFSASDRVNQTIQLGAGQYIKKPYTINQLGQAVRDELDRQTAITKN